MELYLKSFLLSQNYQIKTLSKKYFGHNLGNLTNECRKNGLDLHPDYEEILQKVQDWESCIDARYLNLGKKKQIVMLALLATCQHLHYKIQDFAYGADPKTRRPDVPDISVDDLHKLDLPAVR